MMANIMFYQSNDSNDEAANVKVSKEKNSNFVFLQFDADKLFLGIFLQVYAFGPIKFTFQMIYVGIVTALIVFPASIGIVALFRSLFTSSSQLPVTFFRKQNVGFLGCLEIDLERLRKRREIDGKTSHLQLTLRRDSKMLCPVNALE